ncbi:MAG TPA: F0F1 ATP synthase subunit delta [Candidatus Paceibacterota bacterium]|jgi:F-type H+-transporting ATPase subunit delta|nr:F0F1 ATP synthase subunit delta [Candidatus Paceibacterota bacterium]
MAKISPKNAALAIYDATLGKSGAELALTLKNGVKTLSDKRLLSQSEEILGALQGIIDKKTNTIRMKITAAKALGAEEKKKLEHQIKEKYKAEKVESEFFEKSDLLGGIRIEVGDEVIDSTYKSKLNKLENFLIQSN